MRHLFHRIALLAAAAFAVPAGAAIYRVGSGADCTHATIQAAIDATLANAGDDEIRISGTAYADQALAISADPAALVLAGGYADCTATTADGETIIGGTVVQPVLRIDGSPRVTLRKLKLQDGITTGMGGGIRYNGTGNSVLTLIDTGVAGNLAGDGGGIAITNTGAAPDDVQLVLSGRSYVTSNAATTGDGGGIHCTRATVKLRGESYLNANESTHGDGGGVFAHDCVVDSSATWSAIGVVQANRAPEGHGGGLYLEGATASAAMYSMDAAMLARLAQNRARNGGAIAAAAGATVRLFGISIEGNVAREEGGAFWLAPGGGTETTLLMQGDLAGAPAGAVFCGPSESCNQLHANRAWNDAAAQAGFGAALAIAEGAGGSVRAGFRGTRFDEHAGNYLFRLGSSSHLALEGALVVDNDIDGSVVIGGPSGSVYVSASTIANNELGAGAPVFFIANTCNLDGPREGSYVYRSIVWQPGHPMLSGFGDVQAECFRYLVGNAFAGLPPSDERVVADPLFSGDHHLEPGSPAFDFAPAWSDDPTRDNEPRSVDLHAVTNRFGPQDLGPYERYEIHYAIGGIAAGVAGAGLVLQLDGSENLPVDGNGAFTFATGLPQGASYTVTLLDEPPDQTCSVQNGSGTVAAGDVTSIRVNCITGAYRVGGTVSGLVVDGLQLQLWQAGGSSPLQVPADSTSFQFATLVPAGANYVVTVDHHPAGLTCLVSNGSGTMPAHDVSDIAVSCSDVPQAVLEATLDDHRGHARHGETLVYEFLLRNSGTAAVTALHIGGTASAGLDLDAVTSGCGSIGGTTWSPDDDGFGGTATLPPGARLQCSVGIPVRADTSEPVVTFAVGAANDEFSVGDTDVLVLLRDGFDD